MVTYLAGCGLQSCAILVAKGYPDLGWNPIEGERYLSFLRFAVFCNGTLIFSWSYFGAAQHAAPDSPINVRFCISGESVEENANVVVKLLIRRPECFGPALRGEGGQGLLAAMKEAIKISEDPALDLPKVSAGVSTGYGSTPLCFWQGSKQDEHLDHMTLKHRQFMFCNNDSNAN